MPCSSEPGPVAWTGQGRDKNRDSMGPDGTGTAVMPSPHLPADAHSAVSEAWTQGSRYTWSFPLAAAPRFSQQVSSVQGDSFTLLPWTSLSPRLGRLGHTLHPRRVQPLGRGAGGLVSPPRPRGHSPRTWGRDAPLSWAGEAGEAGDPVSAKSRAASRYDGQMFCS